jgi:hypothetical protein
MFASGKISFYQGDINPINNIQGSRPDDLSPATPFIHIPNL